MADLDKVAKVLILIDGVFHIVSPLLDGIGQSLNFSFGAGAIAGRVVDVVGILISVLVGVFYIAYAAGRVTALKDTDDLALGIIFIVLGIIFGSLLTILAGILFVLNNYL